MLVEGVMCSPGFSCDSAFQVTYIVRGSGRVQVVGVDGHRVLETTVSVGYLFIVPRFFVVSKIANPEGLVMPSSSLHHQSDQGKAEAGRVNSIV